ncbi:MAG: DUF2490 domain-containing protein [Pyrinomonadaceae bacterium]|jgi:hypothetical protein|nr:DUF2490 domain-containing protein [Pyrinomonadaceae bacterium]
MKLLFFSLILLSATFTFAQTNFPKTDTQFWNDITISKTLIKAKDKKGKEFDKISIFFTGNLRFGNKLKSLVDERIGLGFDFKVNKYLTLSPSYLYRSNKATLVRRDYESRFRLAVTLEKKWTKISLKDKNLIEYRLKNSRSDSVRYRNKATLAFPILKDKKELFAPFIADEVFYDFRDKHWTRNEFSAGITRKFTKNFSADFYYLRQDNRSGFPKSVNAFGINWKIKLD